MRALSEHPRCGALHRWRTNSFLITDPAGTAVVAAPYASIL